MSAKIIGKHSNPNRIITGLYSLDHAFTNGDGAVGVPIGIGYEIFGLNGIGKSTFVYSFASILARELKEDVALCDFEGFDDRFLKQVTETCGFDGSVYVISEPEDEDQLDKLIDHLNKNCAVGILDSVGAISPISEVEGELGEANMGRRGLLLAQFSRKGLRLFRFQKDKTILMINHWYPKMGSRGYDTPGGEVKKYLCSVRIKLARKEEFPDGSYALIGEVIKNRWGYNDLKFNVFMLAGFGLHAGLSALWDCYTLKLVRRTKAGITSKEGENFGKLGHLAKQAKAGNTEIFKPFYKILEGYNGESETTDESDGEDGTTLLVGEENSSLED